MDEFDQKMEISEQPQEEIVEKIPGRDVYETVSSLVSALLVVVLVFTFLVRLMGVSGPSMIPTLQDGDRLLVVNSLLCGDYQVGDIVIARKETFDSKPIVKRVIATHVGMTPEVVQQLTEGTLEVNLLPQGPLAECIRAAGAGLGGVLTPVGIDTLVEESPFCMGRQTIDGKDYLLMKPIHADFALLGTYKCDEFGNCWYKGTMRNFNVVMATAADTVIAECEYIVPVGDFEPENIHTYGMCVDYIVEGDRK